MKPGKWAHDAVYERSLGDIFVFVFEHVTTRLPEYHAVTWNVDDAQGDTAGLGKFETEGAAREACLEFLLERVK